MLEDMSRRVEIDSIEYWPIQELLGFQKLQIFVTLLLCDISAVKVQT